MTIVGAIQSMAGGGFVALMVVWFDRVLDIGTQGWRFGLTWSSWSVGALAATLLLPRLLLADLAGSDHAGRPPGLGRVNTAGRMLAWGAGWTGGAALAGLVASAVGVRHAMVLMTTVNLVGVVVAWTSPLRTATASDLPTSESS